MTSHSARAIINELIRSHYPRMTPPHPHYQLLDFPHKDWFPDTTTPNVFDIDQGLIATHSREDAATLVNIDCPLRGLFERHIDYWETCWVMNDCYEVLQ